VRGDRRHRVLLACVLFASAFGLRAWSGSVGLHAKRHWDEGYALDNVRSILETGSFQPARSYYPSPVFNLPATLLVAAAETIHERTGASQWDAYDGGQFRAVSYLLCRWLMALYGAITVLMVWRIGHHLAGERAGVLAAVLLTFLPWHIHASAIFKPDALLAMSVLLTLWAGIRALRRASLVWAAVAGLGVALAASAKLTGVLVAAPLAIGLLAAAPRERRRWAQVLVAAAVSTFAFMALNPYWPAYLFFVAGLKADYAMRARWHGWTRIDAARLSVLLIFDRYVHGPLLGGVAVAGAMGAVASTFRSKEPLARARWIMVLLFPPLYAAVLVTQTAYFKANNLLPVMPFTCLFAAWAIERAWRRAVVHTERRWLIRTLATAGVFALLAIGARPGFVYVYCQVTPSTRDIAQSFLGKRIRGGGRLVYAERQPEQPTRWFDARPLGAALVEVERLDALDLKSLDQGDAEIFGADRLDGENAAFYESRMARLSKSDVAVIRPRWFARRGAPLVVIRHLRRLVARGDLTLQSCAKEPRCFSGALPARDEDADQTLVTLRIVVTKKPFRKFPEPPRLTVAGAVVDLLPLPAAKESQAFATPPLALSAAASAVEILLPAGDYLSTRARGRTRVSWATWRLPRVGSERGGSPRAIGGRARSRVEYSAAPPVARSRAGRRRSARRSRR